ncbi:MAG: hypothetical protein OEL79_04540 [Chromatiales bacterium]|nr:hypothetical protein [Chromatiales bacterium]
MARLLKAILLLALLATFYGCTEEQQNRLSRVGVSWLEGNYKVTYAVDGHVKTWQVLNGKVTSEAAKGYYYFWATDGAKKHYVQTPIDRTYIEEIL